MRRVLAICAIISGVMGLVVGGMWVRGFFSADVWALNVFTPATRVVESHVITATDGWLFFVRSTVIIPVGVTPQFQRPEGKWGHESGPKIGANSVTNVKGSPVRWRQSRAPWPTSRPNSFVVASYETGGVQLWPVIVLCCVLPGVWVWRRVRARRRARMEGQCPGCGYDLRASPHRCPECGRVVGGVGGV